MLRSRRLGQIAERYRKPFLNERMDRISYERNYKKYMLDVMYAMRRELSQFPNANSFYPIYRDEMEYQIALRRAMHDYLAEVIKNGDITNVLHVDLRARYSDPGRADCSHYFWRIKGRGILIPAKCISFPRLLPERVGRIMPLSLGLNFIGKNFYGSTF